MMHATHEVQLLQTCKLILTTGKAHHFCCCSFCSRIYAFLLQQLRAKLATPSKYVGTIPAGTAPLSFQEYSFDSSVLTTLGLTNDSLPLAIITSNTTDEVRCHLCCEHALCMRCIMTQG
jgi:hypothetical protein